MLASTIHHFITSLSTFLKMTQMTRAWVISFNGGMRMFSPVYTSGWFDILMYITFLVTSSPLWPAIVPVEQLHAMQ